MNRYAVSLLTLILLVVGATPAHAAGGELPRVVNFAILAAVLYFALRKPLGGYLIARTEQIREQLAQAAENRARAATESEKANERLAGLDDAIDAVHQDATKTAEAERRRILEAARNEAERIKEMASKQIDAQVEAGRRKLLARATELSVDLAEKKIKAGMTAEDHARLVDRSIELLAEKP